MARILAHPAAAVSDTSPRRRDPRGYPDPALPTSPATPPQLPPTWRHLRCRAARAPAPVFPPIFRGPRHAPPSLLPSTLSLSRGSKLAAADVPAITEIARERSRHFHQRFLSTFPLTSFPPKQQTIAAAAISNLIAGISFFAGTTIQETPAGERVTGPFGELITAVPGRSYFPRGFAWDEGFHQLVVSEWNVSLSTAVLRSWVARIEPSVSPFFPAHR